VREVWIFSGITHCDPNFNLLSLGLMDGLKAATPLSALNSVRDFSASGYASANFKINIGCAIGNA